MSKSFFLSKTFWFNLLALLASIAIYVDPALLEALGIEKANQVKIMAIVGASVALANKVLRSKTNNGTYFRKPKNKNNVSKS